MPNLAYPYIRDTVQDTVVGYNPNTDAISIAIAPSAPAITGTGTQQLTVTATLRDGSTRDVTAFAIYTSATPAKVTVNAAVQK